MKSRDLETEEYGYGERVSAKPSMRSDANALGLLHRTAGSWLMLALAITCTVTTVFTIIDILPDLKGFLIVVNLIRVLLQATLCAGVWMIFINGRRKGTATGGFKCVRVFVGVEYAIVAVIYALIAVVLVFAFSAISGASEAIGLDGTEEGASINTVLIISCVVLVAAGVLISAFFKSVLGILKTGVRVSEGIGAPRTNFYFGAVILIVIGVFNFAAVFLPEILGKAAETILGAAGEKLAFLTKLASAISSSGSGWTDAAVSVCGTLNFILGGVVMILFSNGMKKLGTDL